MNSIRTRFVKMGNSRVLRIPQTLIEQLGLGDEIELIFQHDRLVIQAVSKNREGWEQAFRRIAKERGDAPHVGSLATEWDSTEWEW